MGEDNLSQPWRFGDEGLRYEGIVATAMHCVNSIPHVCRSEPGIKSYLDQPMICGRVAPALQKHQ